MNLVKSLTMALVFVVGALYVWRYEIGPSAKEKAGEVQSSPLFSGIAANDISEVSVSYDNIKYGIKRKANGAWEMQSPSGAATDVHNVNDIVQGIVEAKIFNSLEQKDVQDDKTIYGLNLPDMILDFVAGGRNHKLEFGKKHAFSNHRYAQLDGDSHVYLVGNEIYESLKKTPSEVRDRTPFDFDDTAVHSLDVKRDDGTTLSFSKDKSGEWTARLGDLEFRADGELIEHNIRNVAGLMVKDFIDAPAADLSIYGLSKPKLTLTMKRGEGKNEASAIYLIGEVFKAQGADDKKTSEGLYIKQADTNIVYRFERKFYSDLLQPVDHFRAKDIFAALEPARVSEVHCAIGEAHFDLTRSGASWKLEREGQVSATTEAGKVDNLLGALKGMNILSFPVLGEEREQLLGFDKPLLSLVLNINDNLPGTKVYRLLVGADVVSSSGKSGEAQAPHYAQVQGSDGKESVVVVSSAVVDDLKNAAAYFEEIK